jgi:hypothetical protein
MNEVSVVLEWLEAGQPSSYARPGPSLDDLQSHREQKWGYLPRQTACAESIRRLRGLLLSTHKTIDGLGHGLEKLRRARNQASHVREDLVDSTECFDHYAASLKELIAIAGARSRHVVLVQQPLFYKLDPTPQEARMFWHGGIGPAQNGSYQSFISHPGLVKLIMEAGRVTQDVADETGATFIETSSFVEPNSLNFYDHFHLLPEGARTLGNRLAAQLVDLIADQSKPELASHSEPR